MIEYKFQKLPARVVVWSDTDFAGCKRTRRSTSGVVVAFGAHCAKNYSHMHERIALSSGESGFYGIVKVETMGLGMKGLLSDTGINVKVQIGRHELCRILGEF